MQSGELVAATQGRRAIAFGAGGRPLEQLGVYGDGFVGVEFESLGCVDVAGGRSAAGGSPRREVAIVADGFYDVPARDDSRAGADRHDGPKDCLSVVGLESLAARFLPIVGSASPAVAMLALFHRCRSLDAPVRMNPEPH